MRDGERERKREQREMSHVFHVERAEGKADMETQRATQACLGVCALVCVFRSIFYT